MGRDRPVSAGSRAEGYRGRGEQPVRRSPEGGGGGTERTALAQRDGDPRWHEMRIFEPHAHMTSRTTDDYEAMSVSGAKALVEPAFWLGQPRTSVGELADNF